MKNKKAMEKLPSLLVGFGIAMVVLIVMIFIFRSGIGKEKAILEEKLASFEDCDCDGIQNFLDKCPCIEFEEGNENPEASGCPAGKKATPCAKGECTKAKNTSLRCVS